jgi:hypothetical protein
MTDRERDLDAAVSTALSYLSAVLRYRDAAGITISPPQCERDLWEHVQRAVDVLRRVERQT